MRLINGDYKVNNADLMAWLRLLSGLETDGSITAGDIDLDGDVDNVDLIQFTRMVSNEKPDDWHIIKMELYYTDNTVRIV